MNSVLLAARILLAGVFVVAGVAKLLDLRGSRAAVAGFGVPEALARWVGTVLPIAELSVAVALLVRPAAIWGAAAALVLLIAFVAGIVVALSRGQKPDCHCFGQIHSAPAGPGQIVRNVCLGAVAGFVLGAGPGPGFGFWFGASGAAQGLAVGFGLAAVALLVTALTLWRRNRDLTTALTSVRTVAARMPPGLPVGSLAPGFKVLDVDGNPFTLDELRSRGRPIALVFGLPGCGPCSKLAPEILRWKETFADRLTVGLVGIGAYLRFDAAAKLADISLREVNERDSDLASELEHLEQVLHSYQVRATPSAVLVSPEGTIASATVDGRLAIIALLRMAAERREGRSFGTRQLVTA